MAQTLTNGVVVPTNPDNFTNLTNDLATMGNSANVVVKVANQAARDALTKVAGLCVTRADLGGLIEVCDGTNWQSPAKLRRAQYSATGAGSGNVTAGGSWGLSALTVVSTPTINNPTSPSMLGSNGALTFNEVGDYTIDFKITCAADPGYLYAKITDSSGNVYADNYMPGGTNHPWGTTVSKGALYIPTVGTQVGFGFIAQNAIGVTQVSCFVELRKNQG